MDLAEALVVTRQRRDWLTARIAAKQTVGWEVDWDIRERDAHNVILLALTGST
jgi:hypothetical protein